MCRTVQGINKAGSVPFQDRGGKGRSVPPYVYRAVILPELCSHHAVFTVSGESGHMHQDVSAARDSCCLNYRSTGIWLVICEVFCLGFFFLTLLLHFIL